MNCISGLTPEIYDNYKENLETIPHLCNSCENPCDSNKTNILYSKRLLELANVPSPTTLTSTTTPPHPHPHPHPRPAAVREEEVEVVVTTADQLQHSQTTLPPDTSRILCCQYCDDNFSLRKTKRLCKHCKSIFHTKCFKKVSKKELKCSICLSIELPFHEFKYNMCSILENDIIDNANIQGTSLINPSQMPDNMYDCFNRRGLHFIHINARSMFHKLSEIRLLALKIKPAIISISETWLKEFITNQSVEIINYNIIRRDRDTHAGGVCVYIRSDLAYNHKVELQNTDLEDLWIELLLPKTKPILIGTCYRAPDNNKLFDCLDSTLSKIQPDAEAHILGDFNICLLNNSNLTKNYKNLLKSFNFSQLIDSPIRVTQTSSTFIDHIQANST